MVQVLKNFALLCFFFLPWETKMARPLDLFNKFKFKLSFLLRFGLYNFELANDLKFSNLNI